jgi:hypothetical protein
MLYDHPTLVRKTKFEERWHIYVDQDSQLPFGNATLAAVGTSSWKFVRMYLYHVHIFISPRARPQPVYSIPASYPIRRVFLK